MADSHNAQDGSKRNTYTHTLGRKLHDNNSGKMQWGVKYRNLHIKAYQEAYRVLRAEGIFILNIKNHIRKGEEIDVHAWHIQALKDVGFSFIETVEVKCAGNGFGQNAHIRTGVEYVTKLAKRKFK